MFSCRNLQGRPTPTRFEPLKKSALELYRVAENSFAFVGSLLRENVLSVGSFNATASNALAFAVSVLRAVIVPTYSNATKTTSNTFEFLASTLKNVIVPTYSNATKTTSNTFAFFSSLIKIVVVPTYSNTTKTVSNNFAFASSTLS